MFINRPVDDVRCKNRRPADNDPYGGLKQCTLRDLHAGACEFPKVQPPTASSYWKAYNSAS